MYSLSHTHQVTWLSRFSRWALVSRQPLQTQHIKKWPESSSTDWALTMCYHFYCSKGVKQHVGMLIYKPKCMTYLEPIYTWRSLLSSFSRDSLWKHTMTHQALVIAVKKTLNWWKMQKSDLQLGRRGQQGPLLHLSQEDPLEKERMNKLPIAHNL